MGRRKGSVRHIIPPRYHLPVRAVLDASAILEGFEPVPPDEFVVPPSVVEEISKGRAGRRMRTMVDAGLAVKAPGEAARELVTAQARTMGEEDRLSGTDVDVLALSLELGLPCVTDDYSLQNVAARLGVEARPFKESGIKEVWEWQYRCTGCGRTFEEDVGAECPVCGRPLRSTPRR